MPHTPTVRSFDKHFLRCGRKTKRRREARELCRGLSFSTLAWETCVLSVAVADNSTLKCTLTHSLTDRERKREGGRIYSHLSRRFCRAKVVPGTLLITQAVLLRTTATAQTQIIFQQNMSDLFLYLWMRGNVPESGYTDKSSKKKRKKEMAKIRIELQQYIRVKFQRGSMRKQAHTPSESGN